MTPHEVVEAKLDALRTEVAQLTEAVDSMRRVLGLTDWRELAGKLAEALDEARRQRRDEYDIEQRFALDYRARALPKWVGDADEALARYEAAKAD